MAKTMVTVNDTITIRLAKDSEWRRIKNRIDRLNEKVNASTTHRRFANKKKAKTQQKFKRRKFSFDIFISASLATFSK